MSSVIIKELQGSAIEPYIEELAKLRISIFREYPYLYDGDMEYEKLYLQTYINSPDSLLLIAIVEQKVVGCLTAIPLKDEVIEFQQPIIDAKLPVEKFLYIGESILLPQHRGQIVAKKIANYIENVALKRGYEYLAFLVVERPEADPRKPANYRNLDNLWRRLGYQYYPELSTAFPWKEVGEEKTSHKPMAYWIKPLKA